MITSAADIFSPLCISTGIPRPSSSTETVLSEFIDTVIFLQCPANASSIELSITSKTIWCNPDPSSVSPMYMPGLFLTASKPFNTFMASAP